MSLHDAVLKYMKRTLVILIVIIVIGVVGYFAWVYFTGTKEAIAPPVSTQPPSGVPEPSASAATVLALSENPVLNYWLNPGENKIYYAKPDGKIFSINGNNEEKIVLDQEIPDLHSVKASFDGSFAIASFGLTQQPTFAVFDVKTDSWQALEGVIAAAWAPADNKLATLKAVSGQTNALQILDLATGKTNEVLKFASQGLELDWVLADEIYLTEKPSSLFPSSIRSVSLKTKTVRSVIKEERGLMISWFPGGSRGLKFVSAQTGGSLSWIDNKNQLLRSLPFTTIIPTKCALGSLEVICAVTGSLPLRTALPDDYLKRKFYGVDIFRSWDPETGASGIIYHDSMRTALDADLLTKNGSSIYFVNRYDDRLYAMTLTNN